MMFIDTMMLASTGIVVVMTHQTLSLEKYWKLFPSTLKLPQCPWMYLHTVRVELSLMHETILRVDIVATNVAWESVKP